MDVVRPLARAASVAEPTAGRRRLWQSPLRRTERGQRSGMARLNARPPSNPTRATQRATCGWEGRPKKTAGLHAPA
eukprot:8651892-Pyramimonas_sp.AAC.1